MVELSVTSQDKISLAKSILFRELFSEMEKNELNCLWPSVCIFFHSHSLCCLEHIVVSLASVGEKQAIKTLSRDPQFYKNDFRVVFIHLFKK